MRDINWIQVIVGFLSGGAFGALIKQFFDNKRNRIQPIGKSVEIKSFYDSLDNKLINSQVILKGETKEFKFSRLYIGTIKIINTGSVDFSEFNFGITAINKANIVHFNPTTKDRHHQVICKEPPSLEHQMNFFDISLKPFNRKDIYTFDLLLTADSDNVTVEDLEISSPHAIRWVELFSTAKAILDIAAISILKVGPLTLDFRKK